MPETDDFARAWRQEDQAMAALERRVYADPVLQRGCRNPDQALKAEDKHRIILANSRQILARYPQFAPAHYAAACSLMALGEMNAAVAAAAQAIRMTPALPVYYHIALEAGSESERAAALTALEKLKPYADHLPADGAAMLHFLLGSAYDKAGRYEDAFGAFQTGNTIKRGLIRYDGAAAVAAMERIAQNFPADALRPADGPCPAGMCRKAEWSVEKSQADAPRPRPADGPRPVFVVGMYRSGTSLVEQILAAHPQVYGAGEITVLPEILRGVDKPERLGQADIHRLGQQYLARIRAMAPGAAVVVDKLPDNFLRLGWIARMLPQAKIIHSQRDALDCCFSCFCQMFAGNIGFAYDQKELGQYYKAYTQLMAHWRAALPDDLMTGVVYEQLVAEPETVIRDMLNFCALPWDPACLNFHRARRAVGTASVCQVRRPLFSKSVGRSGPYRRWLQPLVQALGA